MNHYLEAFVGRLLRKEDQLSLVLSLLLGALVGLVIVSFILLTGNLAARMYPAGGSGWRRLTIPFLGSLFSGFLLCRYFPQARGSGIPQTKFALFVDNGRISLRTVIGKYLCCSVSLASGIALGREGPSVHIGAGVASVLARRLGLTTNQVKSLVPVGCAAALAAAFNTPIAAVLFSLEEIMGDLHAPILGSVVLSSATAWMVLHLVLGDDPLFHVAPYHLVHPAEFAVYGVLGVIGGLASVSFVKLLLHIRLLFRRLPQHSVWLQPALGGLTVGLLGWFFPEVLGVGYNIVERVLNGDVVLRAVVLLALLKIFATAVCYSSGNAGGIFGPSLFIGAMIGASVGSVAHTLFPAYTAGPGAYALVGMGTAFAGIIRTPLTSVIMIFELTRDYSIIVPLMISNLIAFIISHRLQREPIYEALTLQDGIHLPVSESRSQSARTLVRDIMFPPGSLLLPSTALPLALEEISRRPANLLPVGDDQGFLALLTYDELHRAQSSDPVPQSLAALLPESPAAVIPHLHPDHDLPTALERMRLGGYNVLPVVSRAHVRTLEGILTRSRVLQEYGVDDLTAKETTPR